jgi:iron complex transport system ATP-binding protein
MNEKFLELDRATVVRDGNTILHDITLSISLDEHAVIFGPNGAGKSSLLKLISSDLRPIQHEGVPIRLFGHEEWNIFDMRKLIGFVSNDLQSAYNKDSSGREVILSGFFGSIGIYDDITSEQTAKAEEVARMLGLDGLLERPINVMSSGEARRFLIARALVNGPKVLVLDEPTNSLDVKAKGQLIDTMRHLAREHCTLLLITHSIEEIIPEIDRMIMMKDGRIFADGEPSKILNSDTVSKLFDATVNIGRTDNGHYHIIN